VDIKYYIDSVSNFKLNFFATGSYFRKCRECGKEFIGDKRAILCLECDIKHLLEPREDKLIVATMYRYGDRELHSYVLGAYSSLDQAMNEGEKERQHRGNKYEPGYKEVIINKLKEIKGGK